MLPWSVLLLCLSARADADPPALPSELSAGRNGTLNSTTLRVTGKTVVLAGDTVALECVDLSGGNISWYRVGEAREEGGNVLTFRSAVEDSGEYVCCRQSFKSSPGAVVHLSVVEKLSPLQVVAKPGLPLVVEGETVHLHCNASSFPLSANWTWHRLGPGGAWAGAGPGRDLVLREAGESGVYSCHAQSAAQGIRQEERSPNCMVRILRLPTTVVGVLGAAAFSLSLLAWVVILPLAALLWLRRRKRDDSARATADGFAGSPKARTADPPQSVSEGNVYMNYTSTNMAYTDLDGMAAYETYASPS